MDNHQLWFVSLPGKQIEPIHLLLKAAGAHI